MHNHMCMHMHTQTLIKNIDTNTHMHTHYTHSSIGELCRRMLSQVMVPSAHRGPVDCLSHVIYDYRK